MRLRATRLSVTGGNGMTFNYLANFVVEGDSRTTLTGAPTASPWPTQLIAALPTLGAKNYVNAAVASDTVATMVGQYSTQIAPYHNRNGSFVLMAGINDRAIDSAATIAANIQTIAASAKVGFGKTYIALENIRNMGSALVLGAVNNILLNAQASSPIAKAFIAPHCLLPDSGDFVAADPLHPSVAGNTKIEAFLLKHLTESEEAVTAIDPATYSGVQLAVDVSDLTKLRNASNNQVSDGDTIATWLDRSPNGTNLTTANGALAKPVFRSAQDLKAEFSIASITTAANFVKSGPFTVYALVHDVKNAGTMGAIWTDNRAFVARPALLTVFGTTVMGEGPGNSAGTTAISNTISQKVVYCAIYNGSNSKLYCDGKLVWTGTLGALSTAGLLSLGCLGGTASLAFGGYIGGFSFHSGAHDNSTARAISKWYSDLGKTYFYPFAI